jgi:poly-beta-1,6-N-acetyl-D-glucosamine synthase
LEKIGPLETNLLMPLSVVDWVAASLLAFAFFVQVIYYLTVMNRVGRFKPRFKSSSQPPVSVIVCAKNESDNLKQYLPLLMGQDYPHFEVIVVNDSSSDDSEMVLAGLKEQYPNLYYTTIPLDKRFRHSKKLAVNIGVKAAKHEHLLFTDADCYPVSKTWISELMNGFSEPGKSLVIGYSPYLKVKGMLNRFIRYDAFWNGVQYLGFAINGRAYMGVGRNMAYTKTLFSSVGGFNSHIYIESGDDDLFVQQAANRKNTNVVISPSAHTLTVAQQTFGGWVAQKARHLSTAPLYKFSHRFVLGLEPFTRQTFWLIAFYALILQKFWAVALGLWFVRWVVQFFVLKRAAKRLNENKIYWALFLFDIVLPFILGYLYIGNLFRTKQIKWK